MLPKLPKIKTAHIIIAHVLLGGLAKFAPPVFTAYYVGIILFCFYRVETTRDRGNCAAKFALYVMGLEILYRIGGYSISWELGKYACTGLFFLGIKAPNRRSDIRPFLVFLFLLLPSVITTLTSIDESFNTLRKMVMFNLSGPLTLVFSGMYFYKRRIEELQLWEICRWAILPGISLVAILFLGPSISSIDFTSNSNFDSSGGFGPNQVSTAIGFFLLVSGFAIWNRKVLTQNKLTDFLLATLLLYRGLLTFSRGGIFAVVMAFSISFLGLFVFSEKFRKNFFVYSVALMLFFSACLGVFYMANKATDNWLIYRYQGKGTSEVLSGRQKSNNNYFAHRNKIAAAEFELFKKNWLVGVGVGMGKIGRAAILGVSKTNTSHTETTRLLAEHGALGAIVLLLLLLVYPLRHMLDQQTVLSQQFFLLFFVLGIMTMLHAAMRMALPGVVTGFAFSIILPSRKTKSTGQNRKSRFLSGSRIHKFSPISKRRFGRCLFTHRA